MTVDLAFLLADLRGWLWAGFMVFLRVAAVIALAPGFGEQSIPPRVRLALALAFTLAILPGAVGQIPDAPAGGWQPFAMAGAEIVTGVFFGLMVRLFVLALQMAGTIAAQSASIAQLFAGSAGTEPMPAVGQVLVIGGLTLALVLGLHVQLCAYLLQTYALVPPGTLPSPAAVMEGGLDQVGRCFALAFTLAAPFVAAALIYNIVLGAINRAMPTLMVTFVGAPALTLGALGLLFLAAPGMLGAWAAALSAYLSAPFAAP